MLAKRNRTQLCPVQDREERLFRTSELFDMRNRERQIWAFGCIASWVLTTMLVCALLGGHGPEKGGSVTVQVLKEAASVIPPLIGPLGADAAPSARFPECVEDHQRRLLDHMPCVQTETFKRYACR